MKQVLQHLRTGKIELANLPCPQAGKGQILIRTRRSLISPGTERMLVEFGRANLLGKASQQPEKVRQALQAGKHVFVEKPLAITRDELREIESTYDSMQSRGQAPLLMVDFNRRFAPHICKMKELLEGVREPKSLVMTVNAGEIPPDNWTQDPAVGGGRIIGEGCHFIDLLRFLVGEPVVSVQATMMGDARGVAIRDDKVSFTLGFADGSFGTVHYLANGHRSFPKERLEVFTGGKILQLDNFRRLRGYGWRGFRKMNLYRQEKGNRASVVAFVRAVQHGLEAPIPFPELIEVTSVSFDVVGALRR